MNDKGRMESQDAGTRSVPRSWLATRHSPLATRSFPIAATVVLVLSLAAGCDRPPANVPQSASAQPPAVEPSVHLVKPVRQTVRRPIEQPGFNIEAFQETPLFARIAGYVRKWNVDIGDHVRKEQVLALLYVPEREAELAQKEAAIRQAAAQIDQAQAAVLTAQAQVERTKSQYERLARVGKSSGVMDQESIDETRLGYEAAKANLVKTKADVAAAQAQLEAAKANRDYAKTMLQYAEIRAPYDGVVTQRNVNTGDFVQPAANGPKGQPLFVVNQIDPVRVFVNVPGDDASWIKDGDPVSLRLQGAGGELIQGKVTRNARSLNPQARTLRTEIDLPNPQGRLLPGMYVQATIAVQHEYAWTLPASALVTEGNQVFCYRVEHGKAVRTPLQVGLSGNGLVEVLMKQTSPSSPGEEAHWEAITGDEKIVANGTATLTNGQAVHPSKAEK